MGAIPLPPFVAGLVVAAGLGLGAVVTFVLTGARIVATGADGSGLTADFRTAAVLSLLVGYTMAAGRYLNLSIARDLIEAGRLRPAALLPENDRWLHGTPRPVLVRSRIAGLVGFLLAVVVLHVVGAPLFDAHGLAVEAGDLWTTVLTPLLFFLLARAASLTAFGAGPQHDEGLRLPAGDLDLLDLRRHLVEGRIGLRLALVWITGSTISSLLFFDPELQFPLLPVLAGGLAVAVMALLLPTRRLHRRIRDAKERELLQVASRLRAARDAVMRGDETAPGRLADLLAYADRVERVREWPIDNRTASRFFLYLLIPIGSWLGGALVERIVSSVLD